MSVCDSDKLIGERGIMLVSSTNSEVDSKIKMLNSDETESSFLRFGALIKYALECSLRDPPADQKVGFTPH